MTIFDFDLEFLVDSVEFIDRQLVRLEREIEYCPDPDGFGLFDRSEQIIGLGFVACQQYITVTRTTIGVPKDEAFNYGPKHKSDSEIVSIINAGANFWKHSSEWNSGKKGTCTKEILIKVLGDLEQDYVLSNLFHVLLSPLPLRFDQLVPFLVGWRDEIRQKYGNGGYITLDEQ